MTNYEKIVNSTPEELAELIYKLTNNGDEKIYDKICKECTKKYYGNPPCHQGDDSCHYSFKDHKDFEDWLGMEVEDDDKH